MPKAKKSTARRRRKMVRTPEEVQRWSALLASEIDAWPAVRAKHMFGFLSYYRKKRSSPFCRARAALTTAGYSSSSSPRCRTNCCNARRQMRASAPPRVSNAAAGLPLNSRAKMTSATRSGGCSRPSRARARSGSAKELIARRFLRDQNLAARDKLERSTGLPWTSIPSLS